MNLVPDELVIPLLVLDQDGVDKCGQHGDSSHGISVLLRFSRKHSRGHILQEQANHPHKDACFHGLAATVEHDKGIEKQYGPDADGRTGLDDLEKQIQARVQVGEGIKNNFGNSDEGEGDIQGEECAENATIELTS